MPKKPRLVLTDPRAIRALAHPARQLLIEELYGGRVLTATECAELAGLTPSATSYHLRALAKWGIIERAGASGDGRERPWRASAVALDINPPTKPGNQIAGNALLRTAMNRVLEELDGVPANDPWPVQLNKSRLWLTQTEAKKLSEELEGLLDKYGLGARAADDRPPGSRQVSTLFVSVPLGSPPSTES